MPDGTKRQRAQWKLRQALGVCSGSRHWMRAWHNTLHENKLPKHLEEELWKCREKVIAIMDEAELIIRERMKHLKEIKND